MRETAEPEAAPAATRSFAFAMFGTLIAGLILIVAIVFAAQRRVERRSLRGLARAGHRRRTGEAGRRRASRTR